jgi:signal transduction histidine kinase
MHTETISGSRPGRSGPDADRVALLTEERERIARDLHDVVIQRLFIAGLGAQALESRLGDDPLADRARTIADELDASIRELRTAIFRLECAGSADPGSPLSPRDARNAILSVADEFEPALGVAPRVVFRGVLEPTDHRLREELLAVLRECLANVARHARATEVIVEVDAHPDQLVLRVSDDGVGLGADPDPAGHGLRNLSHRARALGGGFTVMPRADGGTVAECRIPVTDEVASDR